MGEKAPKKFKIDSSTTKIMAKFFWDYRGVIFLLIDYGHIITGKYYSGLLKNLREKIKDKRRGILAK